MIFIYGHTAKPALPEMACPLQAGMNMPAIAMHFRQSAPYTHVRKYSDMLLTLKRRAGASAPLASLDFARGPAVAGLRISPRIK